MRQTGLISVLVCLMAAGCGGETSRMPSAPSSIASPSAVATTADTAVFGIGAADLGDCFRRSQDPVCFSAAHLHSNAVSGDVTAPGAPGDLKATVSGNSVTLVWNAPASGDAVLSYVLEAGSVSGATDLANVVTNNTATTFFASGIGVGSYFVRVRARNAAGVSASSNEVVVVVGSIGCTGAPAAVSGLSGTLNSGTLALVWSQPGGGCAATSYILQAGSAPGLSNLANFNTGNAATTYVASGVGPSTYYLRVVAVNGNGQSGPSNEILLTGLSPVSISDVNLITNGDAEAGPGSFSGDRVGAVPGWRISGNFTVTRYGGSASSGSFPSLTSPGPSTRGLNMFTGGPDNVNSDASQTIDVSSAAGMIDANNVSFELSGFFGGFAAQNDNAVLTATFKNALGVAIGSRFTGSVSRDDRRNITGLLPRATSGDVPVGTRQIDITLQMRRTDGAYNDGYADNLSLVLHARR